MPSPFVWSEIQTPSGPQHRYRDTRTGRYIPARQVRAELDRFVDSAGRSATRDLTGQLRDGRIGLAEWQTAMARAVKNVNYAAVAAASGGVENMTAVERGRAGAIIKQQYKYLRGFAADIESGKQPLDGRAIRRAEMYAQAARGSYHEQKRAGQVEANPGEQLGIGSVRAEGDSCEDCIDLDGRIFVMGDVAYIPIGQRVCKTSCRCTENIYVLRGDDWELLEET
jgi:hypothetical protein